MNQLESLMPKAFGRKATGKIDKRCVEIQLQIGGELPSTLLSLLKRFDGASIVFDKDVKYRPIVASPWARRDGTQSLEIFFGLSDDTSGLAAKLRCYQERMPKGLVPIGEGPGGNIICLALDGPKKGNVFFWDHEDERPITGDEANDFGNLYLVAKSFDDFTAALFPDETQSNKTDGIISGWLADDL